MNAYNTLTIPCEDLLDRIDTLERVTSMLHEALETHRLTSLSKYVFVSARTKNPFFERKGYMNSLCAKAGVKPFGFHAIRHLSATLLAYGGVDIPSVQAVLRHHNPNTTARYIKSLGIQQDKLEDIFVAKRKGSKVTPFEPNLKAIGT